MTLDQTSTSTAGSRAEREWARADEISRRRIEAAQNGVPLPPDPQHHLEWARALRAVHSERVQAARAALMGDGATRVADLDFRARYEVHLLDPHLAAFEPLSTHALIDAGELTGRPLQPTAELRERLEGLSFRAEEAGLAYNTPGVTAADRATLSATMSALRSTSEAVLVDEGIDPRTADEVKPTQTFQARGLLQRVTRLLSTTSQSPQLYGPSESTRSRITHRHRE